MSAAISFQFDIDKLLIPITPDEPAGANLRYDPVYDKIKDLRREDDARLPQGVWQSDPKRADWTAVEALCIETLETRSKDLQIAAWLTEAWVQMHGMQGAAMGLEVMRALCESFWDGLYPRIDGDDLEFRIAPLVWMNQKLPIRVRLLPLTGPDAEGVYPVTYNDWEVAAKNAHVQKRQAPVSGEMTLARFQQSAMLTPTTLLVAAHVDTREMVLACAAFEKLLDEKLGRQSPGLPALRATGESILDLLAGLLRERKDLDPSETVNESESSELNGDYEEATGSRGVYKGSRIRTRSEAYQLLAEAADFLSHTEPHSPTSYLVRRAIAWGSMSLEELLPELVRNQSELSEIYRLLDTKPPDTGKK